MAEVDTTMAGLENQHTLTTPKCPTWDRIEETKRTEKTWKGYLAVGYTLRISDWAKKISINEFLFNSKS